MALLSSVIQQRFYNFSRACSQHVPDYIRTRIFPQVTSLLNESNISCVLSSLSVTCRFSQHNSQFYQTFGVCPPFAGLFMDKSILSTELRNIIITDAQKNIVLVDEHYNVILVCIVHGHMELLKNSM